MPISLFALCDFALQILARSSRAAFGVPSPRDRTNILRGISSSLGSFGIKVQECTWGGSGRSILSQALESVQLSIPCFCSTACSCVSNSIAAFSSTIPETGLPQSSEEPHEVRQLPHIDLQSPDFLCIFHYSIFMTFYVAHQIDKVFLVHFRSSLNESSCFLYACSL